MSGLYLERWKLRNWYKNENIKYDAIIYNQFPELDSKSLNLEEEKYLFMSKW